MWIIWPLVAALVTGAVALAARKENERLKKEDGIRDQKLALDAKDQELRARELDQRERELKPDWDRPDPPAPAEPGSTKGPKA